MHTTARALPVIVHMAAHTCVAAGVNVSGIVPRTVVLRNWKCVSSHTILMVNVKSTHQFVEDTIVVLKDTIYVSNEGDYPPLQREEYGEMTGNISNRICDSQHQKYLERCGAGRDISTKQALKHRNTRTHSATLSQWPHQVEDVSCEGLRKLKECD